MDKTTKNIKISDKHHEKLKNYCDENGYKLYKVVEKWIDKYCTETNTQRKKNLYGE